MITKTILIIFCLISSVGAEKLPFPISTPNESSNRKAVAGIKPIISADLAILIDHLRKPRKNSFIAASDANETLKWRVQNMTVITQELVVVCFSEGHVPVYGVYSRNHKGKSWDLESEMGGKFLIKSFADSLAKNPG